MFSPAFPIPKSLNDEIDGSSMAVDDDERIDLSLCSFCRKERIMFDSTDGFVDDDELKNGRLLELSFLFSLNSITARAFNLSSFFAAMASTLRVPAELVRYFLYSEVGW